MFSYCFPPNLNRGSPALDPRQYKEDDMGDRVRQHWEEHRVRHIDYCLNGFFTVVGVAVVAFSIVLIVLTHNAFTYSPKLLSFYLLYGGVGVVGGVITIVSIKWMLLSCQKSNDYDRWKRDCHGLNPNF